MRTGVVELLLALAIASLLFWKLTHPYTAFGCDGWGEYRRTK